METLSYPFECIKSFGVRKFPKNQEDTANRSKLVTEAADKVFKFDRLTKVSAYPNGVANATGPNADSLFGTAYRASVAVQDLKQCDPDYKSLFETLENPKGKYKLAPGTAKTVTNALNHYWRDEGMQIGTTFVGMPEPKQGSEYPDGAEGGD